MNRSTSQTQPVPVPPSTIDNFLSKVSDLANKLQSNIFIAVIVAIVGVIVFIVQQIILTLLFPLQ